MSTNERVRLRPLELSDLPDLYRMQLDPESNRLAATIPRTREAFDIHWAKALDDPQNSARAIVSGDEFVGLVSSFTVDGQEHVGYWVDRAHWGMGIGSRALQLLLQEVPRRPLLATVSTSNVASLRILEKCGFVLQSVQHAPASERYLECDEAVFVLK